ncbi:MAG: hypothetical protein V1844_22400 [Pseudomonadota bacterium]
MQPLRKEEELILQEIMKFPREKLPQVAKLLRLLKQELAQETRKKAVCTERSWVDSLKKFRGMVSSTDEFMARKSAEKVLER